MLCYRKNVTAKKFMDKSQGEVSRFIFASIGLTVPKNDVRESFRLSLPLCIGKNLDEVGGGGECHDFPLKIFCLTVPKNFAGQSFRVSLVLGFCKILCFTGVCHDISVRNFLNHNTETFLRRALLCSFRKNLIAKNFMDKREGEVSKFSFESVLSHGAEKCRREYLVFH